MIHSKQRSTCTRLLELFHPACGGVERRVGDARSVDPSRRGGVYQAFESVVMASVVERIDQIDNL